MVIQKFYSFNERAALHGQIKDSYFQVIIQQEMILADFCTDTLNPEGRITNGAGVELTPEDIKESLEKVADFQKRLEGIELEPIPESIAKLLIPFVKKLQKKRGGLQNRNPTLQRFPNILGIKNFYADAPDGSGWCSIHRSDGSVCFSLGSGCSPIDEELPSGVNLLCGGSLFCTMCLQDDDDEEEDDEMDVDVVKQKIIDWKAEEKEKKEKEEKEEKEVKAVTFSANQGPGKAKPLGEALEEEDSDNPFTFLGKYYDLVEEMKKKRAEKKQKAGRLGEGEAKKRAQKRAEEEKKALEIAEETRLLQGKTRLKDLNDLKEEFYGTFLLPFDDFERFVKLGFSPSHRFKIDGREGVVEGKKDGAVAKSKPNEDGNRRAMTDGYEPLYNSMWRWYESKQMFSGEEPKYRDANLEARQKKSKTAAFEEKLIGQMSRNLYTGILHDLYSQMLKRRNNFIAVPLIFINATNSAISASTLANMGDTGELILTLISIGLNIISGLLVSIQKFYNFAERSALHEAVKNGYFSAYSAEGELMADLVSSQEGGMKMIQVYTDENLTQRETTARTRHTVALAGEVNRLQSELKIALAEKSEFEAEIILGRRRGEIEKKRLSRLAKKITDLEAALEDEEKKLSEHKEKIKSDQSESKSQTIRGSASLYGDSVSGTPTGQIATSPNILTSGAEEARMVEVADIENQLGASSADEKRKDQGMKHSVFADLDSNAILEKLKRMKDIEAKLLGLPEVHVPVSVARKLQPYIKRMQERGYEDRKHLIGIPAILGVESYHLEVPPPSGWCSLVSNGHIALTLGGGCAPINHDLTPNGCEILCCGSSCVVCGGQPIDAEKDRLQLEKNVKRWVETQNHRQQEKVRDMEQTEVSEPVAEVILVTNKLNDTYDEAQMEKFILVSISKEDMDEKADVLKSLKSMLRKDRKVLLIHGGDTEANFKKALDREKCLGK
jgi:hypothetical protein